MAFDWSGMSIKDEPKMIVSNLVFGYSRPRS